MVMFFIETAATFVSFSILVTFPIYPRPAIFRSFNTWHKHTGRPFSTSSIHNKQKIHKVEKGRRGDKRCAVRAISISQLILLIQQVDSINSYIEVRSGTECNIGLMEVSVTYYLMVGSIIRIGIDISFIASTASAVPSATAAPRSLSSTEPVSKVPHQSVSIGVPSATHLIAYSK